MRARPSYHTLTPSTGEILSVQNLRDHVKASTTAEGTLLQAYIATAVHACQDITGRVLLDSPLVMGYPCWPTNGDPLIIDRAPISAVTSLAYLDRNGDAQTFTGIRTALAEHPPAIYLDEGESWPDLQDVRNPITLTVAAGYANDLAIPPPLIQGIRWLATWLYENRHPFILFGQAQGPDIPMNILALWQPYRLTNL